MELLEKTYDAAHVVSVVGDLNALTGPQVRDRLLQIVDSGHRTIILDLSRVKLVSSAGLRVIYEVGGKLEKLQGRLILAEPSTNVRMVFDLVDLAGDFAILPTLAEALNRN